jgi:DNA-binding transcriptional ArsR family regulator
MPDPEQAPPGAADPDAPSPWESLASSVLATLGEDAASGRAAMSTARLRKLLDVRQSTLARVLSALEEIGLVALAVRDDGSTVASLSAAGRELLGDRQA